MENNTKEVSIIIPIYKPKDREVRFIDTALESCFAQDYKFKKIIIADDCSPDDLGFIPKRYPEVCYFRNEKNLGMFGNCMHALKNYTTSAYSMFLCDDDYYIDPTYISSAMELITSKELDFVYSGYRVVNEVNSSQTDVLFKHPQINDGTFLFYNFWGKINGGLINIPWISCLFRRDAATGSNIFESPALMSNDYEMVLKLALHRRAGYINRPTIAYRVHESQPSFEYDLDFSKYDRDRAFIDIVADYAVSRGEDKEKIKLWKKRMYSIKYSTKLTQMIPAGKLKLRYLFNKRFTSNNLTLEHKLLTYYRIFRAYLVFILSLLSAKRKQEISHG